MRSPKPTESTCAQKATTCECRYFILNTATSCCSVIEYTTETTHMLYYIKLCLKVSHWLHGPLARSASSPPHKIFQQENHTQLAHCQLQLHIKLCLAQLMQLENPKDKIQQTEDQTSEAKADVQAAAEVLSSILLVLNTFRTAGLNCNISLLSHIASNNKYLVVICQEYLLQQQIILPACSQCYHLVLHVGALTVCVQPFHNPAVIPLTPGRCRGSNGSERKLGMP